jgi:ribosome maturation factor RimP
MDRPLYTPAHYARYLGETVSLRLRMAREGRRKFKGSILKVEGEDVTLNVDGKEIVLPVDAIDKSNIVPRFDEIISRIDGLKDE